MFKHSTKKYYTTFLYRLRQKTSDLLKRYELDMMAQECLLAGFLTKFSYKDIPLESLKRLEEKRRKRLSQLNLRETQDKRAEAESGRPVGEPLVTGIR